MTKEQFLIFSLNTGVKVFDNISKQPIIVDITKGCPKCVCETLKIEKYNGVGVNIYQAINDQELLPIIRNFSDISKPCMQSDYNNGEPFIPITEILKMSSFNTEVMTFDEQCSFIGPLIKLSMSLEDALMLIKWHFWPEMSKQENVVYVTDDFNPYII